MKYLKRFNESVEDIDDEEEEKGGVVEMHLSVPIFSDKWTTFFSCRRSKINDKGIYETIGGCDELELKYFDIVWKKYEGREMPWREMKNGRFTGPVGGPCRPEFKVHPQELIDALTYFQNSSFVTKFEKGKKKRYYRGKPDPDPNREEISKMSLEFQSEEDASDWLDDLEYLIITSNE